jgi:hypothetical protein
MKSMITRSNYGRMDSGAEDGECLGCASFDDSLFSFAFLCPRLRFLSALRYADTMDDEPDVMNDTALRSVVTCASCSARAFSMCPK